MIYLLAITIGFTTILAMSQNSGLSNKIGLVNITVLNYITGASTSLIFFIFLGSIKDFNGLKEMHPYGYFGGLLGLCVVMISSFVLRHISVIIGSMLMFTGQMLASFIIDYFFNLSFSPMRMIGVALLVSGIYINNYIDYKSTQKAN